MTPNWLAFEKFMRVEGVNVHPTVKRQLEEYESLIFNLELEIDRLKSEAKDNACTIACLTKIANKYKEPIF